jgi:hypothetical protein
MRAADLRQHILGGGAAIVREAVHEGIGKRIEIVRIAVVAEVPDRDDPGRVHCLDHGIEGREVMGGMTVVPRDSPFMGRSPGFPDRSPAGPSIYGLRIRLSTPAFVRKLTFNAMSVSALNGFVRGRMLGV